MQHFNPCGGVGRCATHEYSKSIFRVHLYLCICDLGARKRLNAPRPHAFSPPARPPAMHYRCRVKAGGAKKCGRGRRSSLPFASAALSASSSAASPATPCKCHLLLYLWTLPYRMSARQAGEGVMIVPHLSQNCELAVICRVPYAWQPHLARSVSCQWTRPEFS